MSKEKKNPELVCDKLYIDGDLFVSPNEKNAGNTDCASLLPEYTMNPTLHRGA
jgi:hypothetical protein